MTTENSSDSLRDLLTRVAAGDLAPDEAARLLDEDPTVPTVDRSAVPGASVSIRAGGVKLTIVADPSVDSVVADGKHSLRREGSTYVLEMPSTDGYRTEPAPRFLGWVPSVWTGGRGEKVHVRINPALALSVDATASGVDILGLRAPLTLSGSASAVKVRDHVGEVHGSLSMGSMSVTGVFTGPSDLTCELGSLDLRLEPGSDATVTAHSEMGSLKLDGSSGGDTRTTSYDGTATQTIVAGAGSAPFTVSVRMGSANVVVAS